jgi:hypothetical protein
MPTHRHPADLLPGSSLTLTDGRVCSCKTSTRAAPYAGLLEGIKTDIDDELAQALASAQRWSPQAGAPPVVVPPVILTGDHFGTPWAFLPAITTAARFDSTPVGSDGSSSSLVLVWFQMHWGLPTDPELLDAIASVNWNVHAWDWWP